MNPLNLSLAHRPLLGLALLLAMVGCASRNPLPDALAVQSASSVSAPEAWQAALPHGGSTTTLAAWWSQWNDSVLTELVAAAQQASASVGSAKNRIAQARAAAVGAQAASTPAVSANLQASRSVQTPGAAPASSLGAGLQAAWELDLWGAQRATSSAAQQRLEAAELGWHEARVAVAADTAAIYYSLRYCESAAALTSKDAVSRSETARLAQLTAQAGFNAPANAALARASAADANNSLQAAQAQCKVLVKSLVALSGLPEPVLRQKLMANQAVAQQISAQTALFSIAALPADVLLQRPDIVAAQRAVAAASLEASAADAKRYPALTLSGSLGAASLRQAGLSSEGATWSLGPLALSLPLLDGGRAVANTQAAVAAYGDAVTTLRAKVRNAVREVEEALVNLDSAHTRSADVQAAATGYQAALDATQARYRAGLASLVELEDARRSAVFAQQNLLSLERDRIAAWISLYRAAGGGWTARSPNAVAQ